MAFSVQALFDLWTSPADTEDAPARFAELYADPVILNGATTPLADLVARAQTLQEALSDLEAEILQVSESADAVAIAFVMRGRHDGPYPSPLGVLRPTGRDVAVRTIDLLTLTEGKVSAIWVNSDDLGLLRQLDAVAVNDGSEP